MANDLLPNNRAVLRRKRRDLMLRGAKSAKRAERLDVFMPPDNMSYKKWLEGEGKESFWESFADPDNKRPTFQSTNSQWCLQACVAAGFQYAIPCLVQPHEVPDDWTDTAYLVLNLKLNWRAKYLTLPQLAAFVGCSPRTLGNIVNREDFQEMLAKYTGRVLKLAALSSIHTLEMNSARGDNWAANEILKKNGFDAGSVAGKELTSDAKNIAFNTHFTFVTQYVESNNLKPIPAEVVDVPV